MELVYATAGIAAQFLLFSVACVASVPFALRKDAKGKWIYRGCCFVMALAAFGAVLIVCAEVVPIS